MRTFNHESFKFNINHEHAGSGGDASRTNDSDAVESWSAPDMAFGALMQLVIVSVANTDWHGVPRVAAMSPWMNSVAFEELFPLVRGSHLIRLVAAGVSFCCASLSNAWLWPRVNFLSRTNRVVEIPSLASGQRPRNSAPCDYAVYITIHLSFNFNPSQLF